MSISQFDIDNIEEIMHGQGDWFTAKLLRLMGDADLENLDKLASVYPEVFIAFCGYKWGGVPTKYIFIDAVAKEMSRQKNTAQVNRDFPHWIDDSGRVVTPVITHGRDF